MTHMLRISALLAALVGLLPHAGNAWAASAGATWDDIDAAIPFDAVSFYKTFSHRMIPVNGVPLHFVIGGKGDPVVLLHGWPQTWYEWRRVMPRLAEHYTVIAVDLPGIGASGRPPRYDQTTIGELIRQLVQGLGFRRVSLVGHDWGAAPAYAWAAAHPDEVRGLAIVDVMLPGAGLERKLELQRGAFAWWFSFFQAPDVPEMLIAGKEREAKQHGDVLRHLRFGPFNLKAWSLA